MVVSLASCTEKISEDTSNLPLVKISTEFGVITFELDTISAPITAKNFLRYVDEGRLDEGFFYRVVTLDNQPNNEFEIEVIQGGLMLDDHHLFLPPIIHETTEETGIIHENGTVSMARNEPGSATCEFFICIGEQPELDFGGNRNPDGQGFAAFGIVIEGMEIVRKIQMLNSNEQMLEIPVKFLEITRIDVQNN